MRAIGTVTAETDWAPLLSGAGAVVHLLARVHAPGASAASHHADNCDVTRALAAASAAAGIRRFIFISTVKVMGETSPPGGWRETDRPMPEGPYGESKLAAERALHEIAQGSRLDPVVIRPPLVHGPGARANLAALARLVESGWPIPLGAVHNARSLVGVDNLADLVGLCLIHPRAAGETFFVADGPPVSTTALIRLLAAALSRPARLLPVPAPLLAMGLAALGRRGLADRLLGNLAVDTTHLGRTLGWTPPLSLEAGLSRLAAASRRPPRARPLPKG